MIDLCLSSPDGSPQSSKSSSPARESVSESCDKTANIGAQSSTTEDCSGSSSKSPTCSATSGEKTESGNKDSDNVMEDEASNDNASLMDDPDENGYEEMRDTPVDLKPVIKTETDEKGDSTTSLIVPKVETKSKLIQTVPTVVKYANTEEVELAGLSPLEHKDLLLSTRRELKETRDSLKSLQRNIHRLLQIIVSDFDYGSPDDIESIIIDFIRVNGEEAGGSGST